MELFDKNGKAYTAYTQDEVTAKITEATDASKKEIQDEIKKKDDALTKAQTDLTAAQKALTDAGDKDGNFAALRKAKEDAEKALAESTKNREDLVQKAVQGATAVFATKLKDGMLEKLAGGNKDLLDKLKVHYETTLSTMPASTDSEIAARVEAAYKLSEDKINPSLLNQVVGSKPTGSGKPAGGDEGASLGLSEQTYNWGQAFGLKKEDIIKYTKKARSNYVNVIDPNK